MGRLKRELQLLALQRAGSSTAGDSIQLEHDAVAVLAFEATATGLNRLFLLHWPEVDRNDAINRERK
jgi:hypothetical protein